MKVKELVTALSKVDQNLDVLCITEDEDLLPEGQFFLLLDINGTSVSEGERCRVNEGPYLKFGKSDNSEKIAFINVTTDF